MDGFERRRLQKKDAILTAALELFKQYGFNKVSINDIASRASVSPVSIYNFFESKENLKNQLLINLWENHYKNIMDILASKDTIRNKLEKFFFSVADYLKNYSINFLATSVRNQINNDDNIMKIQFKKIDDTLISIIEQGKAEGIINKNISDEAVLCYIDMFRYYFINNPEAAAECDRNPILLKEILSFYVNALFS